MIEINLRTSQPFQVPDDWTSVNTIEIVGGGGGGGNAIARDSYPTQIRQWRNYSRGGAGGGYARVENVSILQPRQIINCIVGVGGAAATEWFMPSQTDIFGNPNPLYFQYILRVTGFHYHPTFFSTGTTTFGNYFSVYGGRYLSESFFSKMVSHIGGNLNFSNWPVGSYTNFVTAQGESKRYLGSVTDGDSRINMFDPISFGGTAGGPFIIGSDGNAVGQGGQAQTLVDNFVVWGDRFGTTGGIDPAQVTKPALRGKDGVIRIRYEPSGTQQACVWIS